MAAAWRKLFTKTDGKQDRDSYARARGGSSSSSSSSSRSSSSSDSDRAPRRSSWLKRDAGKISSLSSKCDASKLSKPHASIVFESNVHPYRLGEVLRTQGHPMLRAVGNRSSAARDEDSMSEEDDAQTPPRRRSRIDSGVVPEFSSQAKQRLDEMPRKSKSMPNRTRSNVSTYWSHFSARSPNYTSLAEEDSGDDSDPFQDDAGSQYDSGPRSRNAESYSREALPAARTAWLGATTTTSPASRARTSVRAYRDHLARRSEYSTVPDTEQHSDVDRAVFVEEIDEQEESNSSSDEEYYWSVEVDRENQTENNTTRTTVVDTQTSQTKDLDQGEHANLAGDSGVSDHQSRLVAEGVAQTDRSDEAPSLPAIDEQLQELEDAAGQVEEQVLRMVQSLTRTYDEGGEDVDGRAMSLAQEEIRYLQDIAEQIRAQYARLRAAKVARAELQEELTARDSRLPSVGSEQEELDRQHALHLQQEIAREDEHNTSASAEQEELDRQHALQLLQDMEAEDEERQRQLEADRTRDCTVCAETKPPVDFPITSPTTWCQHPPGLCISCLQAWMASELDSKGCTGFKCPECPERMAFEDVRDAANDETFAAYDKLAMRSALGGLEEFAWCLRSGCGNGQLNIENHHYMICQACGYRQCLKHQIQWHHGETCDEYDYRVSGRKTADEARERLEAEDRSRREEEKRLREEARRKANEERKTQAMIGTVSKACPANCGRRIQRTQGCDHMRCKCEHEFCWECLAPQKRIDRLGNTAHERHCKNHSDNVG